MDARTVPAEGRQITMPRRPAHPPWGPGCGRWAAAARKVPTPSGHGPASARAGKSRLGAISAPLAFTRTEFVSVSIPTDSVTLMVVPKSDCFDRLRRMVDQPPSSQAQGRP